MPQNFAPCVIIHSVQHADSVLRLGHNCTLLSARGAALAGGAGWWQALVRLARSRTPGTECADILDCADAPGMAMAALRIGQTHLVLSATSPGFAAVARAAAAQGAILLANAPEALDMASRQDRYRLHAPFESRSITIGDRR